MKILAVHSSGSVFGGERISSDIARLLHGKNFQFTIFSPAKGFWNSVSLLRRMINDFDIIHAHGIRASVWVKIAKLLKFSGSPVVYTIHGIHFLNKNFSIRWMSIVFEFITNRILIKKLVCVGENDFYLAKKFHLAWPSQIILIRNGIDFNLYSDFSKKELSYMEKELNLKFQDVILTVCRLHFQKDVATLIKSIAILKDKDVGLLVIGDGPEENSLKKLSSDLGVENKVIFLGRKENVGQFLHLAKIFILSTKWEGLPLTILEAMAAGTPVLASDVGGVVEIINDGENGLLFEMGNEKDLTKKIILLLGNEELRKRITINAKEFVKENYSLGRMVEEYKNIYTKYK